jgi:predicted nucleotidyltransferase component of viral defense system
MNLDFVKQIATKIKTKRLDMVEKDIILHQILTDLSDDKFFSRNFLFKGGTCLIKHHLGYLRFSEDIDFTWKDQSRFDKKTSNEVRRDLSSLIDDIGKTFEVIAKKRDLDFKRVKSDRKYVELGGSNKLCTLKIWYNSEVQKTKAFIKVQINFVEDLCTKPETGRLHSALRKNDKKMASLFAEYEEYSKAIPFGVYNAKEILAEKMRALLTRKGIKARDFLDIYFIEKHLGIKVDDVEKYVIRKTKHTLGLYNKYQTNFRAKKKLIEQGKIFDWGTEKELIISKVDDKKFNKFVAELAEYLKKLVVKMDR